MEKPSKCIQYLIKLNEIGGGQCRGFTIRETKSHGWIQVAAQKKTEKYATRSSTRLILIADTFNVTLGKAKTFSISLSRAHPYTPKSNLEPIV